ncbi:MAG: imidazole glycerol phosphate synthase subunit HisH [Myxococcales bacterium]|nr:imidazole glycerol phosphate synthase subunit HisH [Myxococcales bacterium]
MLVGLRRAGADPTLITDPAAVRAADRVVLPGVGALAAAMESLGPSGLGQAVAERVAAGRPTLTVCLGLQLLLDGSAESPGVSALGCVPGHATRFQGDGLRVPHLGWNKVQPAAGAKLLTEGYAYFAHSYKLDQAPAGWTPAWTTHGQPFVAAMERGPVVACQFHPELSGAWGLGLLTRWLEA